MNFKKWLLEVGMGGGGPGGGMEPPRQNPVGSTGAFSDYHGQNSEETPPKKIKKGLRKKSKHGRRRIGTSYW